MREKSLEFNWQHKKMKQKHSMFAQENYDNFTTQQINNQQKLITEMDKDPNKVLLIILDMWKSYTEYFD